jgi:pimeloyl-ACP methyl ester carboxylesterase
MKNSYIFVRGIKTLVRETLPKNSHGYIFIVFHGWNTGGGGSWESVINDLCVELPHTHIIVPDLPGMGESSAPEKIWGIDEYVLWAHELCLLYEKDNQSLILLGHSFGGVIAAHLAGKKELNTRHLFLLAPAIVRNRKPISTLSIFSKALIPNWIHPKLQSIWRSTVGSSDYKKTKGIMREVFSKIIMQDTRHVLSKITVPTTIIWGKKDTYTPYSQAEIIHTLIINSKLVLLPNINHGIHLHAKKILLENILMSLT